MFLIFIVFVFHHIWTKTVLTQIVKTVRSFIYTYKRSKYRENKACLEILTISPPEMSEETPNFIRSHSTHQVHLCKLCQLMPNKILFMNSNCNPKNIHGSRHMLLFWKRCFLLSSMWMSADNKTKLPENASFVYDCPSVVCSYDGAIHAYDQGL